MKLDKKKLAARALGVGVGRITFNQERLAEVKEALTKQDIRDLVADGAIAVREIKGRRVHVKRGQRRRGGSIRKRVIDYKGNYMVFVRSARRAIAHARMQGLLTAEQSEKLRREVRARTIASKASLQARMTEIRA